MSEETGYTPGDMSDEQEMWKPHVHQTLGLNLMLCITRPQKVCRHPCGHIFVHSHVWNRTRNKRREQKSITVYSTTKKDVPTRMFEIRIIQQASSLHCLAPISLHPLVLCFIHPSVLSSHFKHKLSTKSYRLELFTGSTNICSTFQQQPSTRLTPTNVGKKTESGKTEAES